MRTFLPVTAAELCTDLSDAEVIARELIVPRPSGPSADDREFAEYDATVDASLASLELVRDTEQTVQRRIVLALDGEEVAWKHVVAILIDGEDAVPSVSRACSAQTQDEADEALEELLEFPLEWYDVAERDDLCSSFASA